MNSKNSMPILYVAVFLLALNGLFSKLIPLDAVSITQLRSALAAVSLLAFGLLKQRKLKLDNGKQYIGIYLIGIILGLHWVSFFHSMQVSTVAIGMLSLFTYPIITVLIEPLYTKQKLQLADIMAGFVVLLGLFIMLRDTGNGVADNVAEGIFWGVTSAFLFALRNLLQKYHYNEVPSDALMLHQVIAVSLMLFIFVDYPALTSLTLNDGFTLILLGVISTATAHTLLSYSLKALPAKSIAMISCLQPFIATLFAWLILSEKPSLMVFVGGLIIISVALYESLQKKY